MTFNLYTMSQTKFWNDSWLISDWNAGQAAYSDWDPSNVWKAADGSVFLRLDPAPAGSDQPYDGAEIQRTDIAPTSGSWSFVAKAPEMVEGAVFGMFLYQADWRDDWLEYDFEFVGEDTTEVEVTVHMEDPSGKHIRSTKVVDLGFDAAKVFATYTINVDHDSAEFYVNGVRVAQFTARDMPDGQWDTGPLHSYVDLWAAKNARWAGVWAGQGTLTAQVRDATYSPSTATPFLDVRTEVIGDERDNTLLGTASSDLLMGRQGNDRLRGEGGLDLLAGGRGHDRLHGGDGRDRLSGGGGADHLSGGDERDILTGGAGDDVFRLDLRLKGSDVVTDFGNVSGNDDIFRIAAAEFGNGLVAGRTLESWQFRSRGDNLAQDGNDRFIFRTTDMTLWFDADGRGGKASVMIADLQQQATLTSADILVV